MGFSEMLVSNFKKLETTKLEYHLSNIYNSSRHAHDLLENLLTWAKMQTKSLQFNPQVFDIQTKVVESIELLEGAAAKKNIRIDVIASEEILVFADVNMCSAIIRNLVGNAIKFTHEEGNISIHLNKMVDFCQVMVMDDGVGISEENIQKIFRIDSNHSTLGTNGEKGTGLGLVLCKEFVEKHNGQIRVESEPGKGSTFIFTLPMKR
jgi:signal transduction histidine kinase